MQGQASIRQGYVAGEFMTRTYRISGEVEARGTPILDQLNDLNALFLHLERMFISPLLEPAVLTGNFEQGEVRKDTLGLVVLSQWRDGLPLREGRYVGPDHADREVFVVVSGFEIEGAIRLHKSVNVPNFVRTTPEQFIPIFDAQATLTARRSIVFKGGAILVNRSHIEVFAMLKD